MITVPTSCFYMIRAAGEAAECVTAALSTGVMADIEATFLISSDFSNDMQAAAGMDDMITTLKGQLVSGELAEQQEALNPLYIPSSPDALHEMLDSDINTEGFRFVGMDGSPYTMKTINISMYDQDVIQGKVACRPFELPSYSDIMQAQKAERLQ